MVLIRQSSTGLSRSTLKILLVFGLFSVCAATSRYDRMNGLRGTLNGPTLMQSPGIQSFSENRIQNDQSNYTPFSSYYKRDGTRRCGVVLLKYIQKLCNGCVDRPKSSEEPNRLKRSKYQNSLFNLIMYFQGFDPFIETESLTDLCCKKSCDDDQLAEFCC